MRGKGGEGEEGEGGERDTEEQDNEQDQEYTIYSHVPQRRDSSQLIGNCFNIWFNNFFSFLIKTIIFKMFY